MNAWRLAAVLLTTTASVLAAEPAGGPEATQKGFGDLMPARLQLRSAMAEVMSDE